MNKDTGGPAFPQMNWENDGNGNIAHYQCDGMTLRDYFAANAMPVLLADYCESAQKVGFDEQWMMGVAIDAYSMADALLEARKS